MSEEAGNELITIPLAHYEELTEERDFLECLKCAGVDNWQGYDMAREMFSGEEDED